MEDDDDGGGSGGGEARRVEQKEDDDRDDSNSDDDESGRGSKEDGGGDGEGGVGDDDNAEGEGEEEGGEGSVEIIEIEEEEGRDAEGEAERVDEEEQEQAEEERGGEKREDGVDGEEEGEGGGRAEEQNREAHAAEEGGEGGGSGGGDHMNATINLDLDNDEYWRPQERNILRGMRQRCRRQAARHRLCQLSWGPKKRARSDLHEYDSVPRVLQPAGQRTRNPRATASPPPHQQRAGSPALQQGSVGSPRQQATGSPGQQAAGSPGQQPRRSARLQAAGPPPVPPLADLLKFAQKLPRPPPRVSQGRLGCLDHVITFSRRSWRLPAPERAPPSSPRQPLQALRRKEDYLGMKVVEASDLDTAYNRLILPERAQRFLDTRGFVPPQVVLVLDEEMAGPSGWFMKYSKWDGGHYVLHGMELLPFLQHLAVVPGQDCLSFFYVPRMHTLRLLKSPIHTLH